MSIVAVFLKITRFFSFQSPNPCPLKRRGLPFQSREPQAFLLKSDRKTPAHGVEYLCGSVVVLGCGPHRCNLVTKRASVAGVTP